jgi:protein arginine kinase
MSELALVNDMQAIVPQITRYEKEAREAMSTPENKIKLEDTIWRDVGLLQSARTITSTEALNALSSVRLGVHLGIIRDIGALALNYLLVYSQPAHLQRLYSRDITTTDRDILRAQYIRKALLHIDLSGI